MLHTVTITRTGHPSRTVSVPSSSMAAQVAAAVVFAYNPLTCITAHDFITRADQPRCSWSAGSGEIYVTVQRGESQ